MKNVNKNPDKKLNRDIHRSVTNERFPQSKVSKESVRDAKKMKQSELDADSKSESDNERTNQS
jgi:hypothetical protein